MSMSMGLMRMRIAVLLHHAEVAATRMNGHAGLESGLKFMPWKGDLTLRVDTLPSLLPPMHRTTKQVEFRPEVVANAPPPPPAFKEGNSGPLMPSDVPTGPAHYVTQQRAHYPGRSLSDSQSLRPSGCRATQQPGYNIITGAVPFVNNSFEHFDARDYRRHR